MGLIPENIASTIKRRWRDGETPDARGVFRLYPDFADHHSWMIDIALEEYCVRRESGQKVDSEGFCSQFPDIRRSLARQIEVYDWVERHPDILDDRPFVSWPEAGTVFLDRFLIRDELGRGSLARAYLCEHLELGNRQVVLKVACGGEYEAGTLGRLNHPNIMPVYAVDVDEETGVSGICMPFRGRSTLYDLLDVAWNYQSNIPPTTVDVVYRAAVRLQRPGDNVDRASQRPMPIGTRSYSDGIRIIAQDLTDALHHAHSYGIVHGDLKPSNVLLTPEGRPILMDFNLSKDGLLGSSLTGGTLPYMSPEQLRSVVLGTAKSTDIDWRSDIFSLGVILYELLTGRLPFGNPVSTTEQVHRSALAMLQSQQEGPADPRRWNPMVDRELAQQIVQCLQFEPRKRPVDMPQWWQSPSPRGDTPLDERRGKYQTFPSLLLAVAATIMLGIAIGMTAIYRQEREGGAAAAVSTIKDTPFEKGLQLVEDGDWITAIGQFEIVIKQSESEEQRAQACAMAGYCHQQRRGNTFHLLQADSYYRRAYEAGFRSLGVVNNLGVSCRRRKMVQEADAWFEVAMRMDSGAIAPKLNLLLNAKDDVFNFPSFFPIRLAGIADELVTECPDYRNVASVAAVVFTRCMHFDDDYRDRALEQWRTVVDQGNVGRIRLYRDFELFDVFRGDEPFLELSKMDVRLGYVPDFPTTIHPITQQSGNN